jgi:hypothetical protein
MLLVTPSPLLAVVPTQHASISPLTWCVLYVCFLTQGSFAFVTVKGGRHEVPESAPAQAMELLTRIIEGTPF